MWHNIRGTWWDNSLREAFWKDMWGTEYLFFMPYLLLKVYLFQTTSSTNISNMCDRPMQEEQLYSGHHHFLFDASESVTIHVQITPIFRLGEWAETYICICVAFWTTVCFRFWWRHLRMLSMYNYKPSYWQFLNYRLRRVGKKCVQPFGPHNYSWEQSRKQILYGTNACLSRNYVDKLWNNESKKTGKSDYFPKL